MVDGDEWRGEARLAEMGLGHSTVCHAIGEWARDDDVDGLREMDDNTLEGMWAGLRDHADLPRSRQGISAPLWDVAIFEWSYNVKRATPEFLGARLGVRPRTGSRT